MGSSNNKLGKKTFCCVIAAKNEQHGKKRFTLASHTHATHKRAHLQTTRNCGMGGPMLAWSAPRASVCSVSCQSWQHSLLTCQWMQTLRRKHALLSLVHSLRPCIQRQPAAHKRGCPAPRRQIPTAPHTVTVTVVPGIVGLLSHDKAFHPTTSLESLSRGLIGAKSEKGKNLKYHKYINLKRRVTRHPANILDPVTRFPSE